MAGETIASALDAVRAVNAWGASASLDFLGEDVLEREASQKTRDVYLALLDAIRDANVNANVSVKLTAMGLSIDPELAFANLTQIVERARQNADPFVRIDMEGSAVTQTTLDLFERAFAAHDNVGEVLQAYLHRTPGDVARAVELRARVRLCKGAYREPESVALQQMPQIRTAYVRLAEELLAHGNYPGIATHDVQLIEAVKRFVSARGIARERFEFQMLYGCRPEVQRALVDDGWRLRVYVPFGTHWASYFYRRVVERRENFFFALSSMFSK